jgi:hypothetical protein
MGNDTAAGMTGSAHWSRSAIQPPFVAFAAPRRKLPSQAGLRNGENSWRGFRAVFRLFFAARMPTFALTLSAPILAARSFRDAIDHSG